MRRRPFLGTVARWPRYPASPEQHARIVTAFTAAWQAGDVDALVGVLDPDVVLVSDGGGVVNAVRRPIAGRDRVTKVLATFASNAKRQGAEVRGALVEVNGLPGLLLHDGQTMNVISLTVDGGRIVAISIVRNPHKLQHVSTSAEGLPTLNAPAPEERR